MSKRNSDEMTFSKGTVALERDEIIKKEVEPIHLSSKKPKLAFSINKKTSLQNQKEDTPEKPPKQKKPTLREAFNSDTESEEEMPKEARMKMRNFGRDTPTSSGPNSFGKTRHGFCDAKKLFEKQLKRAADELTE